MRAGQLRSAVTVVGLGLSVTVTLAACGPAPGPPGAGGTPAPSGSGLASAPAAPSAPASAPASTPASTPAGAIVPPSRRPGLLTAQIRQAEAVLADPGSTPGGVRRAGEFEQLAARALAVAGPVVRHRVLSGLSGRAAAVTAADVAAARSLGALTAPEPRVPPGWRIVAPLPPAELMRLYRAAQRETGIRWEYLAAINFVETKFGRVVGPSTAGAQGPMQFMPATWAEYGAGGRIHDPRDAIPAAARLLAASGGPRDMAAALRAYNDSSSYVRAVTAYAHVMRRWPRAFLGYWSWRVLFKQRSGTLVLPVGYPRVAASPLG